jgi:hypothetical protein
MLFQVEHSNLFEWSWWSCLMPQALRLLQAALLLQSFNACAYHRQALLQKARGW